MNNKNKIKIFLHHIKQSEAPLTLLNKASLWRFDTHLSVQI